MEFLEFFENFGDIFGKYSHKTEKVNKIWLLVGKLLSFLTNMLEFSGKMLEFFPYPP